MAKVKPRYRLVRALSICPNDYVWYQGKCRRVIHACVKLKHDRISLVWDIEGFNLAPPLPRLIWQRVG